MKEELKRLSTLQEIDIELDQLKDECEYIPKQIEKRREEIQQKKNILTEEKNKIKEMQLKHKSLELELGVNEEKIKKQKMDLNSVKTNEQYKVLLLEIKSTEASKSQIEDKILEVITTIDEFNKHLKESEKALKDEDQQSEKEINELLSQKSNCENTLAVKSQERNKISLEISEKILKKYEHIRKNLEDGVAISHIQGNNCGVCGMRLPAQIINEVSKYQSLVFCENCSRILFFKENNNLIIQKGEGRKAALSEQDGEESPNSRTEESEISSVKG